MKRVSKNNLPEQFSKLGFSVSSSASWYGHSVFHEAKERPALNTFSARLEMKSSRLLSLLLYLASWVSKDTERILWIQHYKSGFLSLEGIFCSILGESHQNSSLDEWPGFHFDPIDIQRAFDQTLEKGAANELEMFLGILSIVTLAEWDAKLLSSESSDHVEFWEGNIVFYSNNSGKLRLARQIAEDFGLPKGKK